MEINQALSLVPSVRILREVLGRSSFTGAARALSLPVSTVSKRVSELEQVLGVSLLRRTTRSVGATEAGERLLLATAEPLETLVTVLSEFGDSKTEVSGVLRVTAPADLAASYLAPLVDQYCRAFPRMSLELVLADRYLDLVGERIDLAVRAGPPGIGSYVARRLGVDEFSLVASPKRALAMSTLRSPRELTAVPKLLFQTSGERDEWVLTRGRERIRLDLTRDPSVRVRADDLVFVRELAVAGAGVALLPLSLAGRDLEQGRLKRVFSTWCGEIAPLYAVYPRQARIPLKTRAFLDLLVQESTVWRLGERR